MRHTMKALAGLAVAAAVVLPATAGNAMSYSVINPTNGCTYSVYGPDFTINTLPKPGVTKTGGVGESVSCP
jgi:hypothetical protein